MTIDSVRRLPRNEKLRLMEALWEELSRPESQYESPAWHATELAKTERHLAQGKQKVMDWEAAKKELATRFGR